MLRISDKTIPWVFSTPKQSVECGSEKVGKELIISSICQKKKKMQGLGSEKEKTVILSGQQNQLYLECLSQNKGYQPLVTDF